VVFHCDGCSGSAGAADRHGEWIEATQSAQRPGIAYAKRATLHRIERKHADPQSVFRFTGSEIHGDAGRTL
jgi:hypothetical protein